MSNKNDRWSALSMKERADLMNMYITNGISDLKEMKKHYNSFSGEEDVENAIYYDNTEILPTINIKDFNRRDLKSLAFKVAGRENEDYGITSEEVLNDKVNYNSKFSRQEERFKRLVKRQNNKNLQHAEQIARAQAAAQGDTQAFKNYITTGTNKVAPLFIPAVLGPAAAAVGSTGALTMAAKKGANSLANILAKNYVRWPLEALSFGDFIYRNLFTDEGIEKTIDRFQEGDYWGGIGSGIIDGLDIVGTLGAGYDAFKLLKPKFNKLGTKVMRYYNRTPKKRRDYAWELSKKAHDERVNTRKVLDDLIDEKNSMPKPTLSASLKLVKESLGKNEQITSTTPFKLPDGSVINIETKVGNTGDVIKEYPILDKEGKLSPVAYMDFATASPVYVGPSGRLNVEGLHNIPLQASQNSDFSGYVNQIQETMGNSGVVGGSSVLYSKGYISGVPNDLEVITTKSRKADLIKKLEFDTAHAKQKPMALSSTSKKAGGKGNVDIQTIDEDSEGFAVGKLAHELYRILHPEEHAKYLSATTLKHFDDPKKASSYLRLPKSEGGYYTANELLDEFNKNGSITKKTLVDALSVGKIGLDYEGTKLMRPIGILSNTDPALQGEILDAIHTIGKFNLGEDFKTVKQLYPNIDYSDIRRNEEFLEELGFDKRLASNPQAMENITEYYHLQLSSSTRVFHSPQSSEDDVKFAHATKDWGGGSYAGAGGNSTIGTGVAFNAPYHSMSQFPLVKNGEAIKTPLDIMDGYYKNSQNVNVWDILDSDQVKKLENAGIKMQNVTTLADIEDQLRRADSEALTEEVGNILGINGVFGGPYNSLEYFGRYSKTPTAASYRIIDSNAGPQVDYEVGRLLHKYKTYSANSVSTDEVKEFRRVIMSTLEDFMSGKISEKEGFSFSKGDFEKFKSITEEIDKLFKRVSDIDDRVSNIRTLYSKLYDAAEKVDNIVKKSIISTVGAGVLGGGVGITLKDVHDSKLIQEYGTDFLQSEEGQDDYYTKLMSSSEEDFMSLPASYRKKYAKEHKKKQLEYAKKRKKNKYLTIK
jgi:hypothetical protein